MSLSILVLSAGLSASLLAQIDPQGAGKSRGAGSRGPAAARSTAPAELEAEEAESAEEAGAAESNELTSVAARPSRTELAASLIRDLAAPSGTTLAGTPVTLRTVLSRLGTRGEQAAATAAYWRLSAAVAEYTSTWRLVQAVQTIEQDSPQDAASPEVQTAAASIGARLREVELQVVEAQFALEAVALLPAGSPPLPADVPHTGPYHTAFEKLFSTGAAPLHTRRIDRGLPLRRRAIEIRAQAVQAADDAAVAADESWREGQAEVGLALASLSERAQQEQALIRAVQDYNLEIAQYAMATVPGNLTSDQLVGILIKVEAAPNAAGAGLSETDDEVQPAGFDEPTLAEPDPAASGQRTAQRPISGAPPAEQADGKLKVTPQPAAGDLALADPNAKTRRDEQVQPAAGQEPLVPEQGPYAALADLSSARRAQELATLLHWERELADGDATAVSLAELLAETDVRERPALIEAYWQGREAMARYHVRQLASEQLQALKPLLLRRSAEPGGAEHMLRLQAAVLAAQADVKEAEEQLLSRRYTLTIRSGRREDAAWLLPTTSPHAGSYRMKLEKQPAEVTNRPAVRRLAATLPGLYAALTGRAEAVVTADLARVDQSERLIAGTANVDAVIAAIDRQAEESFAFLADLTAYNRQIAEYVATVLSGSPLSTVVKALVLPAAGDPS